MFSRILLSVFLFHRIAALRRRNVISPKPYRLLFSPILGWIGLNVMVMPAHANLAAGIEQFHQGNWQASLEQLQQTLPSHLDLPLSESQVQALRYRAQAQWQLGQQESAIQSLTMLANHYRQGNNRGELGRILTLEAQYLTELGNLNQARRLLCHDSFSSIKDCAQESALFLTTEEKDLPGQVAALGSLGILLNKNGDLALAQQVLEAGLELAKTGKLDQSQLQLLNSLGQTHFRKASRETNYAQLSLRSQDQVEANLFQGRSRQSLTRAVQLFEQGYQQLDSTTLTPVHIDTALNLIQAYQAQSSGPRPQIERLFRQTQSWLNQLPLSQTKLYAAARLAQLRTQPQALVAQDGGSLSCPALQSGTPPQAISTQVSDIVQMARRLNDREVESFSLGLLGQSSRCQNQLSLAKTYTEQAIAGTQKPEHRYRWEWQLGQIFQAQGQLPQALKVYKQAVQSLEDVRGDLVVANRDFQLDLQANVEGLYRDLSYLQLQQADLLGTALTEQAVQTLDRLRLVELQNYLADDCELPPVSFAFETLDSQTAILRTVIFSDRMAIALTYRDRNNQPRTSLHWVNQSQDTITRVVNDYRFNLEKKSDLTRRYLQGSQILYNWLIQPFEKELNRQNVGTMVFIHDGILRSVPMATLHDGRSFLVESYAIANATHWTPQQRKAQPFDSRRMVAFGLTESAQVAQFSRALSYAPLPGVQQELTAIQANLKGSQVQQDQSFSPQLLRQTLTQKPPQTLHLATHARFGVDPRETFLVTGSKQSPRGINETIRMPELYQLIRSLKAPISLLTLTGCETAVGNERDALGMTGVALQAGVDTVMASLWQLDDRTTGQLVPSFYLNLEQGMSKARALRDAQVSWLRQQKGGRLTHPGYWASLILVGDWR